MKTIKFFQLVKYPVLLLVAVFGVMFCVADGAPQAIFGNKVSQVDQEVSCPIELHETQRIPFSENAFNTVEHQNDQIINLYEDIGGGQVVPRTPCGLGSLIEMQKFPANREGIAPYNLLDIGGQRVPNSSSPLTIVTDIGGNQSAPRN